MDLDWSSIPAIATILLSGHPIIIVIAFLTTIFLPIVLHFLIFHEIDAQSADEIILLGPSGAGKSALVSALEQGSLNVEKIPRKTHTSEKNSIVQIKFPAKTSKSSDKPRSASKPGELKEWVKLHIYDTPGHGKLRNSESLSLLSTLFSDSKKKNFRKLRGVIFMVDSAALGTDNDALLDAARYLHDCLLVLQRKGYRDERILDLKKMPFIPVLLAANKQDLFTALPPTAVREKIQDEIEKIKKSRKSGLSDADVNPLAEHKNTEEVLGRDYDEVFSFKVLGENTGIKVDVSGGAVNDDDNRSGLKHWESWIGHCL